MSFQQGVTRRILTAALCAVAGFVFVGAQALAADAPHRNARGPLLTGYDDRGAAPSAPAPRTVSQATTPQRLMTDPQSVYAPRVLPPPPVPLAPAADVPVRRGMLTGGAEVLVPVDNGIDVPPMNDAPVQNFSLTMPDQGAGRAPILSGGAIPQSVSAPRGYSKDAPVDLIADSVQHDDSTGIVSAAGSVDLNQAGRKLRADHVSYNLNDGTVRARGHIVLNELSGDLHFADEVELGDEMARGTVTGLRSYLHEGGQFTAARGERHSPTLLTLHEASYTPCDCDMDADGNPAWRIRAKEVRYNQDENKISYRHPRFEVFGTPVLWLPYLAHSDGKIKRQSGFLPPSAGYTSRLGAIYTQNYYWDMAPHRDMTIGTMLTTREAPVALAEYRQRWARGRMKASGSLTYSGRIDDVDGRDVGRRDETRGHLFADGRWDLNDKWRAGFDVEMTTDDAYLRQYRFSKKDVLENTIYAERFSGRDYASVRAMAFQDVRVLSQQSDQPHVVPEAIVSFIGEPNAAVGGRWAVNASVLGLTRDGSGQDVARGVVDAGWQRRDVGSFGLVNTLDVHVRGDAYAINDRRMTGIMPANAQKSDTVTRAFPQMHNVTSLPLAKPLARSQIMVEPLVALTVGANINNNNSKIPNEDSEDVQLDSSTLFNPNRFPGADRIEDRNRVTYGVRSGIYGHGGSHLTGFIGQSYNLHDNKDNPFPSGSGLTERESDVVGSVSALYDGRFGGNYRFQLASTDLSSQRHEFDGFAHWKRLSLGGRYLYAKAVGGTIIDDHREQVEGNMAFFVTEKWRARVGGLYDLGVDDGLRRAVAGLDYYGCCMSFGVTAERNLTTDSSGDGGTSVMMRIGLKGIGPFERAQDNYWGGLSPSSMPRQ